MADPVLVAPHQVEAATIALLMGLAGVLCAVQAGVLIWQRAKRRARRRRMEAQRRNADEFFY